MATQSPVTSAPFGSLVNVFLKITNLTFGGGDPTMVALQREFTERRGWLTMEQHALIYSLARITPGTNVLAYCAGAAWTIGGTAAAAAALMVASIPASLAAVWLVIGYQHSSANRWAQAAVEATIAAVVGMMLSAAFALMRPQLTRSAWPRVIVFAGGTLLLREWFALGPVQLIAFAAAAGYWWYE